MDCRRTSLDEFASNISINLSTVKRNRNSGDHNKCVLYVNCDPYIVAGHLRILAPSGSAVSMQDVYIKVQPDFIILNI